LKAATDELIRRLANEGGPVRRLRPPAMRASGWLIAAGLGALAAIWWLADMDEFHKRSQEIMFLVELGAALATGVAGVLAAFELSLPDRRPAWTLVPLPFLALWIAASGTSCYEHLLNGEGWASAESLRCFIFILGISIPLGLSLALLLRTANPLAPVRVAVIGGLGVAALAAFLLQFFHPFDVTFLDLAIHALAVIIVVYIFGMVGKREEA
jgi:hypothetical protein